MLVTTARERFLEALLESAVDYAIIGLDLDGLVTSWNQGAAKILGWSEREMIGKPATTFFTLEDRQAGIPHMEMTAALETGHGSDERWHVRKDGNHFWASGEMMKLKGEDGTAQGFVKILRDRTEQRQTMELQRQDAEFLRSVLAASGDCIKVLDLAGRLIFINQAGKTLLDIDDFSVVSGKHWPETWSGNARDLAEAALETARNGGFGHFQGEAATLKGTLKYWDVQATAMPGPDGKPARLLVVSRDITRLRGGEVRREAMLELETRMRDLTDASQMAYIAAKLVGQSLNVMRAGYGEVLEDADTVMIEREWTAFGVSSVAGLHRMRDYGSFIENLRRGEPVVVNDVKTDARTRPGGDGLAALGIGAILNLPLIEHGRLVAIFYINASGPRVWTEEEIGFTRDVTDRTRNAIERRRAEQRLQELAASLEEQVAARTQSLQKTEEALRQSQKMEALGQLTGGIAHDFNNLLTGIIGSLDILRRRLSAHRLDDLDRFMDAASASANRAASLTHRLLAFARRQSLDTRPSDVNALVAGMEDLLHRSLGEIVQLTCAPGDDVWLAMADAHQLENAILNLAINARDAMENGGRLTIETANISLDAHFAGQDEEVEPGDYVVICVSDTGSGMSREVAARAFDPFFTTKPIGEGTGLGLSMIYGFVKQSGGHVRIYSEVGKGTTVKIFLRRADGMELGAPEMEQEVPLGRGETVLVVEDDPTVRLLMVDVLDELGYNHVEVPDGQAAVPILQSRQRIDLLLTDVGLPNLNGRQVAEIGRQSRPDLKVLFVTGYAEKAAVRHGFLEPGMEMLMKPFALEALAMKIRAMIEKST